ncbi:NgoPII family restriction endonuclease [Tenacibaculum maritimum]|uniref:NgoPII family restriction endonuclease n=1 Tax=Tenacibaculum maritimum TaxID=107401 RepID=UPI0012E5DDB0|nr:NgoPII family restriction endonuclease [Tenacibaculum maritimum]CAA0257140.1 Type II restriction enzyme [Tenacibaculum maritimum]
MTNILEAIYNISQLKELTVKDVTFGSNRATSVGDGLESFIKDSFTNTFNVVDKKTKLDKYKDAFSYEGSSRTPPDLMLKGGDAIEVKKTESISSDLQLNSSHPKAKLLSTSSLINKHCANCETWSEKDFIYAIGHIPKGSKILSSLWFIDGSIYAADEEVYLSLKENLTTNIETSPDIDFSPTNEIGRVNSVDPLKITNLRIRGMWLLQPPYKVFDYVHGYDSDKKFQCITILPLEKYDSFPKESKDKLEGVSNISIVNVEIQNPNNPVNMINCKLIKYVI